MSKDERQTEDIQFEHVPVIFDACKQFLAGHRPVVTRLILHGQTEEGRLEAICLVATIIRVSVPNISATNDVTHAHCAEMVVDWLTGYPHTMSVEECTAAFNEYVAEVTVEFVTGTFRVGDEDREFDLAAAAVMDALKATPVRAEGGSKVETVVREWIDDSIFDISDFRSALHETTERMKWLLHVDDMDLTDVQLDQGAAAVKATLIDAVIRATGSDPDKTRLSPDATTVEVNVTFTKPGDTVSTTKVEFTAETMSVSEFRKAHGLDDPEKEVAITESMSTEFLHLLLDFFVDSLPDEVLAKATREGLRSLYLEFGARVFDKGYDASAGFEENFEYLKERCRARCGTPGPDGKHVCLHIDPFASMDEEVEPTMGEYNKADADATTDAFGECADSMAAETVREIDKAVARGLADKAPVFEPVCRANQLLIPEVMENPHLAIVCLWTPRETIPALCEEKGLSLPAVIGQLYSKDRGFDPLLRNLLANPQITRVLIMGDDKTGNYQTAVEFFTELSVIRTVAASLLCRATQILKVLTEGIAKPTVGDMPEVEVKMVTGEDGVFGDNMPEGCGFHYVTHLDEKIPADDLHAKLAFLLAEHHWQQASQFGGKTEWMRPDEEDFCLRLDGRQLIVAAGDRDPSPDGFRARYNIRPDITDEHLKELGAVFHAGIPDIRADRALPEAMRSWCRGGEIAKTGPHRTKYILPEPEPVPTEILPGPTSGALIRDTTVEGVWLRLLRYIRMYGAQTDTHYDDQQQETYALTVVLDNSLFMPTGACGPVDALWVGSRVCVGSSAESWAGEKPPEGRFAKHGEGDFTDSNWMREPQDFREDLHREYPEWLPMEGLEKYADDLWEGNAPQGVKYTYGSLMRHALTGGVVPTTGGLDHLHGGVKHVAETIDAVEEALHKLLNAPDQRSACIPLFTGEHARTASGTPCLVFVGFRVARGKFHASFIIRSNDMFKGFPQNLAGFRNFQWRCLAYLQRMSGYLCDERTKFWREDVTLGDTITVSLSAHIYADCWDWADQVLADHYEEVCGYAARPYDPFGNFTIEVVRPLIEVKNEKGVPIGRVEGLKFTEGGVTGEIKITACEICGKPLRECECEWRQGPIPCPACNGMGKRLYLLPGSDKYEGRQCFLCEGEGAVAVKDARVSATVKERPREEHPGEMEKYPLRCPRCDCMILNDICPRCSQPKVPVPGLADGGGTHFSSAEAVEWQGYVIGEHPAADLCTVCGKPVGACECPPWCFEDGCSNCKTCTRGRGGVPRCEDPEIMSFPDKTALVNSAEASPYYEDCNGNVGVQHIPGEVNWYRQGQDEWGLIHSTAVENAKFGAYGDDQPVRESSTNPPDVCRDMGALIAEATFEAAYYLSEATGDVGVVFVTEPNLIRWYHCTPSERTYQFHITTSLAGVQAATDTSVKKFERALTDGGHRRIPLDESPNDTVSITDEGRQEMKREQLRRMYGGAPPVTPVGWCIRVVLLNSVTGEPAKTFESQSVDELREQLAPYVHDSSHAMYLGVELHKAAICLWSGVEYVQDQPLKFAECP